MRCFSKTNFHENNQIVDVGPELVWDDLYKALKPYNISVVRGLVLYGGQGWKSNEYGLTIDHMFEYEV